MNQSKKTVDLSTKWLTKFDHPMNTVPLYVGFDAESVGDSIGVDTTGIGAGAGAGVGANVGTGSGAGTSTAGSNPVDYSKYITAAQNALNKLKGLTGGGDDAATKAACGTKPSFYALPSAWSKYHTCVQNLNARCSTPGELAGYDALLSNPNAPIQAVYAALQNADSLIADQDRQIAYFHSIGENPASDKFPCLANHKSIYIDYAGRLATKLQAMGGTPPTSTGSGSGNTTTNNNTSPDGTKPSDKKKPADDNKFLGLETPTAYYVYGGSAVVATLVVLGFIGKSKGWFKGKS